MNTLFCHTLSITLLRKDLSFNKTKTEYLEIATNVLKMLLPFPSSYLCEVGFRLDIKDTILESFLCILCLFLWRPYLFCHIYPPHLEGQSTK